MKHKFERQPVRYKINPTFRPINSIGKVVYRRYLMVEIARDKVTFEVHDTYYLKAKPDKSKDEIAYTEQIPLGKMSSEAQRLHHLLVHGLTNPRWEAEYISKLFDELAYENNTYMVEQFFPDY